MVACSAVILVVPVDIVRSILLAAWRAGAANGDKAFIFVDTQHALNVSSQLVMDAPWQQQQQPPYYEMTTTAEDYVSNVTASSWKRALADEEYDGLKLAAQSLMVLKAHSVSLLDRGWTQNNSNDTSGYKVS